MSSFFFEKDPKSSVVSLTQDPEEGGPNSSLEGFFGEEPTSSIVSLTKHPEGGPESCSLEGFFVKVVDISFLFSEESFRRIFSETVLKIDRKRQS